MPNYRGPIGQATTIIEGPPSLRIVDSFAPCTNCGKPHDNRKVYEGSRSGTRLMTCSKKCARERSETGRRIVQARISHIFQVSHFNDQQKGLDAEKKQELWEDRDKEAKISLIREAMEKRRAAKKNGL